VRSPLLLWAATFKNLLLCCVSLLWGLSACSKGGKKPPATELQSEQAERDFILQRVYSGQYCFRTRFYGPDSLRNMHDICQVWSQRWDSVNQVRVEFHGWQGRDCDTNRFIVLRQRGKRWFVPFCDEMRLAGKNRTDTTFFKTDLVVTRPLNAALSGLVLRDRSLFLTTCLDVLLPNRRLTRANYKTLLDAKTRVYLHSRLASPKRYFYRMAPSGRLNENVVWEFDDTQVEGLHVRVIRPTWYKCFEL
jgi:hypothetical protein